jgi:hypothetical protein
MNFGAEPPDAALPRVLDQRAQKASANALTSPLRCHEECNHIHGFAAEFGAPHVGSVRIPAKCAFGFRNDNKTTIGRLNDLLKNASCILRRSFSADISEELSGKVTQVIQIFWICRSNLKSSCAHVGTHDDEGIL